MLRLKKSSTVPEPTVNFRGSLLPFLTPFLIFFSPQFRNLSVESLGHLLEFFDSYRCLCAHKVPVVVTMAIVVPEDSPVVQSADNWVDICEVVPDYFAFLGLPNL